MPDRFDDEELRDEEFDGEFTDEADDGEEAEVDEAVQAAIDKKVQEALAKHQETLRASLLEQGLDLSADGRALIREPQKVAEFVSPFLDQREYLPPVTDTTAETEDDERAPDPYTEPEKHAKWTEKQIEKRTAHVIERLQLTERRVLEREATIATEQVKRLLPESLSYLAEHPEFDNLYRQSLLTVDPQLWGDPQTLRRLAGWISVDLQPTQQQQKKADAERAGQRDGQGRFVSPTAAGRMLTQQSMDQFAPARDTARTRNSQPPSEWERQVAEFGGMTVEEMRALNADPTGDAYRALKRKREAARK